MFASDSFGSNRREIPDSAWLQLSGYSLESCLRSLEAFLDAAGNKCKRIFTGHNAEMMDAQQYLSTLRKAMHNAVDNGAACLFPSLRSAAESFGSGSIAVEEATGGMIRSGPRLICNSCTIPTHNRIRHVMHPALIQRSKPYFDIISHIFISSLFLSAADRFSGWRFFFARANMG